MHNRQVLFVKRPEGAVTPDCFDFRDGPVPEPREGEVLIRNIYLSCDPYMRGQMGRHSRGPFAIKSFCPRALSDKLIAARGF